MRTLVWSGLVEPNKTRAIVYEDGSVSLFCDRPTDAQRASALSRAVEALAFAGQAPFDPAASFVRELFARAGLRDCDCAWPDEPCARVLANPNPTFGPRVQVQYRVSAGHERIVCVGDVYAFIRALCDLATGDRDGAARVLREAER